MARCPRTFFFLPTGHPISFPFLAPGAPSCAAFHTVAAAAPCRFQRFPESVSPPQRRPNRFKTRRWASFPPRFGYFPPQGEVHMPLFVLWGPRGLLIGTRFLFVPIYPAVCDEKGCFFLFLYPRDPRFCVSESAPFSSPEGLSDVVSSPVQTP